MNRREFIEIVSSLAGSTLLMNQLPWFDVFNSEGQSGFGANDRVRIGFIGVGSRGRTLLLNVQSFQERLNVEIAAVCDTYEPHLERAKTLTNNQAEAYLDYREMLKNANLDAVVIATPLHVHAEMTIDALRSGKHVYLEKSMARTLEDVKRIYDTYLETRQILQIGHQRMFSPVYLDGLSKIQEGTLGQITMLRGCWMRNTEWLFYDTPGGRGTAEDRLRNWRLYWDSSAGMITELGSHHFQVANWVLGTQPISVMGSGALNYFKDGREVDDTLSLLFEYPDGILFSYDCLNSNRHNGMNFQVLGKDGTMELEANKLFMEDPPKAPALRSLIHSIEQNLFETIPIGGATWIPDQPVEYGGEYISDEYQLNETQLALEAFTGFVREGSAPRKLTDEGYHASIWSLLAEEATKTGRKITLPEEYRI